MFEKYENVYFRLRVSDLILQMQLMIIDGYKFKLCVGTF